MADDRIPDVGTPAAISEAMLCKLTVAQIKEQLRIRDVYFPSSSLKQQLLDQLRACLHLPVVKTAAMGRAKQSKKVSKWNKKHPMWKLLRSEIKEGNIPVDSNEMGPTAVYERYSNTFEFQMEKLDFDIFINCLRDVRQEVAEEEPILPWNEIKAPPWSRP